MPLTDLTNGEVVPMATSNKESPAGRKEVAGGTAYNKSTAGR